MAIAYLDVDDEITTAAARIRDATDLEVVLVLPAGSRIATSRINFRLLAHEAFSHSRRLAIVAPEGSTRALAASAGLPVFATIPEYEEARGDAAGDRGEDAAGAGAGGAAAVVVGLAGAEAAAVAGPAPGAAGPARGDDREARARASAGPPAGEAPASGPGGTGEPGRAGPATDRSRASRGAIGASTGLAAAGAAGPARRSRWPLFAGLLLAVVIVAGTGAAVGYVALPSATVTVSVSAVPVGPVSFTGVADPSAVAVDPATATMPATTISIPLSATGTFKATGKRVESSAATGQVRWTNCDPTDSYTVRKGTIVRTPTGVAFLTQEEVFLPVAILDPPQITCQSRTVDVRAQRDGPAGNVAAGTITVVPGSLNSVVIRVTNPAATSGGARDEFPQVTEADVVAAAATLAAQLDAELAEAAADPPSVPAGATVYPATAQRGDPAPSPELTALVGTEVQAFELTLVAEGTVLAADPAPLQEIALTRLATRVPEGMVLRDGSEVVEIGPGAVVGQAVEYAVTARAEAYRPIEEAEVRELVRGRTPAEAEAALAPYGEAEVVLWPDWATTVTTFDPRLQVTVVPLAPASAGPSPTPRHPTPPPATEAPASASPAPDATPAP